MTTRPPRVRVDPRDRTALRARPAAARGAPVEHADSAIVRVEEPACHILAVADGTGGRLSRPDRELLDAARQLADLLGGALVLLLCIAPDTELRCEPGREGADRVILLHAPAFADEFAESRLGAVLAVAEACQARHLLFPETALGGDLGRRVAARLGDRAATNLKRLTATAAVCGSDGNKTDLTRPLPRVLVPAPGAFEPVKGPMREARPIALAGPPTGARVRLLRTRPLDPAMLPLREAELIIGAGDGVTDWASFHAAASALGAAEAGSRVVCDAGVLPRSRQVGASGVVVEPRCYLAFGIAGAAQHLHGIAGAERVVAVNTDLRADMIKRADLAIVADAQAVLPALVRRAAERRGAPR